MPSSALRYASIEGVLVAFASGACAGLGYALLADDNARRVLKRSFGGGLLVVSLYVFSPAGLRKVWLE